MMRVQNSRIDPLTGQTRIDPTDMLASLQTGPVSSIAEGVAQAGGNLLRAFLTKNRMEAQTKERQSAADKLAAALVPAPDFSVTTPEMSMAGGDGETMNADIDGMKASRTALAEALMANPELASASRRLEAYRALPDEVRSSPLAQQIFGIQDPEAFEIITGEQVVQLGFEPGSVLQRNRGNGAVTVLRKPEGAKPPQSRDIVRGGETVTQEWTGSEWRDVGSGPRWAPQKAEAGSGGPFAGTGLDAQVMNILIQGDPNTPEYAAAYARQSQEKAQFDPTTGQLVTIRPDMSPFRAPTFRQGVGAPAQPAAAVDQAVPVDPAAPVAAPGAVATPGAVALTEGPAMPPGSSVSVRQVAPPQPKPMTGEQSNAALFADRMTKADEILQQVGDVGTSVAERTKAAIPGVGNYLVSKEYQQFDQAKRDFINAVLRRESGAVIADSEFANAERQYFPQPGDTPEVLKQKAANRRTAIDAIGRAAGAGYTPPQTVAPAAPMSTELPPLPPGFVVSP